MNSTTNPLSEHSSFSGPSVDDMSKSTTANQITDVQTCGGVHAHVAVKVMIGRIVILSRLIAALLIASDLGFVHS